MTTAYDFIFDSIDGGVFPLAAWVGRPILIVNTATECGFTPQFRALQKLWEHYRHKGLIVLAVPSNDFGNQERRNEKQISAYCQKKYKTDFPMTTKTHVTGSKAHPFYQWANRRSGFIGRPHWNFHKYLIGTEGQLVDWYLPFTSPTSPQIESTIRFIISVTQE